MSINVELVTYLPTDCFEKLKEICAQHNWTYGELLLRIMNKPPPIEPRTSPPPKTKRSDSPCKLVAFMHPYHRRELEYICGYRSLSRRDGIIILLDHYINTVLNKEANHG